MSVALKIFVAMALLASLAGVAHAKEQKKIRLILGEDVLTATMEDNATSADFLKMLPLTLNMKDYSATEKISNLPRKLDTQGSERFTPKLGDITIFAPWGNLAIFYREFNWSPGLILLGRIESGIEKLAAQQSDFTMTIEEVK